MAKKRVKKGKHIIFKVWIDDENSFSSMRFFFNAPSKSSQSGRAKILMNFIEFHCIFDDFLRKFDRLVLGCINEFLNFLFGIVERVFWFRNFLKKNTKLRKKREWKFVMKVMIFLMRLLIVKVNKLGWIITQRNWLVSKIALGDH